MKNLIFLAVVLLCSCTSADNTKDGVIVKSVFSTNIQSICKYYLQYANDASEGFYITDSIGKFKIEDTLFLFKKHSH